MRLVIAGRVAGVRAKRHRITEHDPGPLSRLDDSREPQLAHPGRDLAVKAQADGVVAAGERQFGTADLAEDRAEYVRSPHCPVDSAELVLRVSEPAVGDGAQHEQRAQLDLVIGGAEPLHDRQRGLGVPDRGGAVAHGHGQLGQQGPRHRRGPRAVVVDGERQRTLGGLHRADRIA